MPDLNQFLSFIVLSLSLLSLVCLLALCFLFCQIPQSLICELVTMLSALQSSRSFLQPYLIFARRNTILIYSRSAAPLARSRSLYSNRIYMLTHRGFSAWIVSGGRELPEYLVAVDEAKHRVQCWVPSEEGKVRRVVTTRY